VVHKHWSPMNKWECDICSLYITQKKLTLKWCLQAIYMFIFAIHGKKCAPHLCNITDNNMQTTKNYCWLVKFHFCTHEMIVKCEQMQVHVTKHKYTLCNCGNFSHWYLACWTFHSKFFFVTWNAAKVRLPG
jgi:hypothetical protein